MGREDPWALEEGRKGRERLARVEEKRRQRGGQGGEVGIDCENGRARVDSAGDADEGWLERIAGEDGAGEVGSKRGEPEATPRVGRVGGDRLRWWRAMVAHIGDDGDMKARVECSLMLEKAWWIRGDRLLSDRPEPVELALEGDARPALFRGVGGASASSFWASTSLWGRPSAGNGEVMLGREKGLSSSSWW